MGIFGRLMKLSAVKVYFSDASVRQNIYLLRSLVSGVMYSAFNMFAAILYNSRWFAAVCLYYVLLATMRYILYLTGKKHCFGSDVSVKLYRNCLGVGIVMLFLNIAMATMIVYTIITSRAKNHSLVVIYFLAIYSVSVFVFNTASMIITRKQRLPYSYIIARILSFCASFMSLFNFVNSLVYTLEIRRYAANSINIAVGAAVIVSVLFLSVSVIYKCNKRISEYKNARS